MTSKPIRQSYLDYLHKEQDESYILKYFKKRLGSKLSLSLSVISIILSLIFLGYKSELQKFHIGHVYDYGISTHSNLNYGVQYVKYINLNREIICSVKFKPHEEYNVTKSIVSNFNTSISQFIHLDNQFGFCEFTTEDSYNNVIKKLNFYHGTFLLIGSLMLLYYAFVITNNLHMIKSYIKNKFKKKNINDISIELLDDIIYSSEKIKRNIIEKNDILIGQKFNDEHSV